MSQVDDNPISEQTQGKEIISRAEAKARGLPRYFTGTPCPKGHISERFVSSKCVDCNKILCREKWHRNHPKILTVPDGKVLISRDEAKAKGLTRFFTGKPCKYGHLEDRFVANKQCLACLYRRSKEYWKTPNGIKCRKDAYERQKVRPGYIKQQKEYLQRSDVKKIRSKRQILRVKTNLKYRLPHYLRCRLRKAIVNGQKSGSAVNDVGCTIEYLKYHLERQFERGMTWKNWGKKWDIDHIKPLSSFDLTDRVQLLEACNYKNLRPMWKRDNLMKGGMCPVEYEQKFKGRLL